MAANNNSNAPARSSGDRPTAGQIATGVAVVTALAVTGAVVKGVLERVGEKAADRIVGPSKSRR
jgi:hypothetical protein